MFAFTFLECSPSLSHFGRGRGLVSPTSLARLFNGKLESCSIHTSAMGISFCWQYLSALFIPNQQWDGKEVSIPVVFCHSVTVSTCQSIVIFALSYIYVKGWQPHNNSLFSVDVSIQEVLKMILAALFILEKVILICVIHNCKTNMYMHMS